MTTPRTPPRRIELIAPSGYPPDPTAVERALARLREAGHTVGGENAAHRRHERFAGTDSERSAELNRFADPVHPLPDVALAVRGGYGAVRLLDTIDYDGLAGRLAGRGLPIVGQSDFTAIQLALLARAGLTTFSGPMLAMHFGAETPSEFTMRHFWGVLDAPSFTFSVEARQSIDVDVDVSGKLWGGNLATIVSLVGTPYLPRVDGGILFVEDTNEQPFRVERMIYQLHLAGVLARQRALMLGQFSGIKTYDYDNGYDLAAVIEHVRRVIGIPVLTGLPFGHVADIVTLPVGGDAHLMADADGFRLSVSNYPHLS